MSSAVFWIVSQAASMNPETAILDWYLTETEANAEAVRRAEAIRAGEFYVHMVEYVPNFKAASTTFVETEML